MYYFYTLKNSSIIQERQNFILSLTCSYNNVLIIAQVLRIQRIN